MMISSTLFYNAGRMCCIPITHRHMKHEDSWDDFRCIPVMKTAHNVHYHHQSDNHPRLLDFSCNTMSE